MTNIYKSLNNNNSLLIKDIESILLEPLYTQKLNKLDIDFSNSLLKDKPLIITLSLVNNDNEIINESYTYNSNRKLLNEPINEFLDVLLWCMNLLDYFENITILSLINIDLTYELYKENISSLKNIKELTVDYYPIYNKWKSFNSLEILNISNITPLTILLNRALTYDLSNKIIEKFPNLRKLKTPYHFNYNNYNSSNLNNEAIIDLVKTLTNLQINKNFVELTLTTYCITETEYMYYYTLNKNDAKILSLLNVVAENFGCFYDVDKHSFIIDNILIKYYSKR